MVNEFGRHATKLGEPLAYVIAVGIKTLALRYRVEYPKIWLRVAPTTRRPLPSRRILGEVSIGQVVIIVALAAPEINHQVFGEKACRHHARSVVNIPLGAKLPG